MRLLRAELLTLRRPLTWAVMAAAAVFCVLLAIGGGRNAAAGAAGTFRTPASCAAQGVTRGPECAQALATERARISAVLAEPRHVAGQLSPIMAGAESAGMMASLPGALVIALLAGGHAGGEWSGRTIKNLLVQHGRRWQVLFAKLVSLWFGGVAVLIACWAALALAGPVILRIDHLPPSHLTIASALAQAGGQAGQALLVIAAFAAIGLLAAVLTRGSVGTMAATAAAVIVMLLLTSIPGIANWTPAVWVQGWMHFPAGPASITPLPTNFWSRFITASGSAPGRLAGLAGVSGLLLACLAIAIALFRRADVSG